MVVTASNDLVGNQAPPGLILFAYTLPSVLIRAFVPYIRFPTIRFNAIRRLLRRSPFGYAQIGKSAASHDGNDESAVDHEVNYSFRITVCCLSSFIGLQLLSFAPGLPLRVLGIMLTSLSSNLGDMSFYQLATRYPVSIAQSFGGYAAGSGAAGLLGSGVYTLLTGIGGVETRFVLAGMGLVPTIMLGTYIGVLPGVEIGEVNKSEDDGGEDGVGLKAHKSQQHHEKIKDLAIRDKLRLVKPMVWGYMLPLATLMLLENTTIQGILPTSLFHLPLQFPGVISSLELFKSTRDFYPTYITIYQLFVFVGRTSINFVRFPNLPDPYGSMLYWGLCAIELVCFFIQLGESYSLAVAGIDDTRAWFGPGVVMAVIALMGLCGGLGMSNIYWRVSKEALPKEVWRILGDIQRKRRRGKRRINTDDYDAMNDYDYNPDYDEGIDESNGHPDTGELSKGSIGTRLSRSTSHNYHPRPSLGRSRTSYLLRARSPSGSPIPLSLPLPMSNLTRSMSYTEFPSLVSSSATAYKVNPGLNSYSDSESRYDDRKEKNVDQLGDSSAYGHSGIDNTTTSTTADEEAKEHHQLLMHREEEENETTAMLREFLISTIALPDAIAIFIASLVSLWMQPGICRMQVANGRGLCEKGEVKIGS